MSEFVICISNEGNPASLIVGKVYHRLPDPEAEAHDMIRVIDEDLSEPDGYLYPASMFVPIELPEEAKRALRAVGLGDGLATGGAVHVPKSHSTSAVADPPPLMLQRAAELFC